MALGKNLILRRPRSDCLEGRTAPIQPAPTGYATCRRNPPVFHLYYQVVPISWFNQRYVSATPDQACPRPLFLQHDIDAALGDILLPGRHVVHDDGSPRGGQLTRNFRADPLRRACDNRDLVRESAHSILLIDRHHPPSGTAITTAVSQGARRQEAGRALPPLSGARERHRASPGMAGLPASPFALRPRPHRPRRR